MLKERKVERFERRLRQRTDRLKQGENLGAKNGAMIDQILDNETISASIIREGSHSQEMGATTAGKIQQP